MDDGFINTHDAKTHLSQLLARVEAGETIIIARDGRPVAKLVPIASAGKRQFGALRGKVWIGPEFFEPLPEDELKAWE
ncbi:MAG TPA: type II toxin-antitoxin system Phd/YefM family antitoxin [Stellaceae bacterium]|nr:type II toxin-antitoxin system Phd/YefM family antitoxin [Stellaceae bacterium]